MALVYNRTKAEQTLLKAHETSPPSLSVDLFTEYWRLNSGPNCLYHTPIATLLEDIRARRIPVDFIQIFHALRIPFYDGSLIVEIHDHRDQPVGDPVSERVVLWPNDETLYAEICLAASKDPGKTDLDALTFEANHLIQREPELILDPDPLVSKVVNASLAVSTPLPVSFKRKREAIDTVQEEEEKVQRARTMNLMNPRANKSFVPDFRVIDRILQRRQELNQTQNREGAVSGSSEAKPQLGRHPPSQHPPQPTMTRKADPPAPGANTVTFNDGPSSRRRSNATQPPPAAILSIANNLRRRNGAIAPAGKAIDESSPNESPAPQQPVLPPPVAQPLATPAAVTRTMTPVQKPPTAPLGLGKPPEHKHKSLQLPAQPHSSPALPAAQTPQQSHPDVHPPRPLSQQAANSGPQTNLPQVPNGVGGQVVARPTQPAQPSGAVQQNNGANGSQPLNRPPQQPSQYQPPSAHMPQQQQQTQPGVMNASTGNSRAAATPTPNSQQAHMQQQVIAAAAAAARHPTPVPQQISQSHQSQQNPPGPPPTSQQQANFQGLSNAARYPGHGAPNVSNQPSQQLPNGMQMPNIVQAAQQQQRLHAMNNPQNFPHQQQQSGQQTSNAAALAAFMASRATAAQQPQQQTNPTQRPNATAPAGAGSVPNQNPAAMAQYIAAVRAQQPQYNPAQLLLHHQQVQQQRAQQVPHGSSQQSQQLSQVPPQPQPPQPQQGAPPGRMNLQHLSPTQLQNVVQQMLSQPGMTPQQRQSQVKALLTQIQANSAGANPATGALQGSANAVSSMPINPNVASAAVTIAQLVHSGKQQEAAAIMRRLQTANPGVDIQALFQNYQQQRLQAQSQPMPQNSQSSQALPAQTQTAHAHAGSSPLPNPPFVLGPLPQSYIPNWRGRGGGPAGNVHQGQQPTAPGLGRGGR